MASLTASYEKVVQLFEDYQNNAGIDSRKQKYYQEALMKVSEISMTVKTFWKVTRRVGYAT